jgi:hypothetical protein
MLAGQVSPVQQSVSGAQPNSQPSPADPSLSWDGDSELDALGSAGGTDDSASDGPGVHFNVVLKLPSSVSLPVRRYDKMQTLFDMVQRKPVHSWWPRTQAYKFKGASMSMPALQAMG